MNDDRQSCMALGEYRKASLDRGTAATIHTQLVKVLATMRVLAWRLFLAKNMKSQELERLYS